MSGLACLPFNAFLPKSAKYRTVSMQIDTFCTHIVIYEPETHYRNRVTVCIQICNESDGSLFPVF